MNTSSVALWLAEIPWGFSLAGRWTALLVLAWVVHGALGGRNPRWRVLLWRSAAVGLATIVLLTAAPPFVTWRLPRAESVIVQQASWKSDVPLSHSLPVLLERPAPFADRQTTAEPHRRLESAERSSGGTAVALSKAAMTAPSLGSCLLAIWLLGAAVMAVRLGLCVWRVSRIVRRSRAVPPRVIEECRAVAATLGCRQAVRVVQTAEVPAPCLTGLFQPWLLLPEANCEETDRADLRSILAHELAHAGRHDLVWNVVIYLVSILLWFHPLAWRLRAAHLAACDAVCDALAADLVGDVALYGRTLARLALQVVGPTPVPGVAMARTPDVFLRIEAVQRRVYSSSLSSRFVIPTLFIGAVFVILIGGFGITRAKQPATPKEAQVKPIVANAIPNDASKSTAIGPLALRVLSARTGEPLEGVSVSFELQAEGKPRRKETVTTGKDGTTAIEWPAGITIHSLMLDVKKPGYVAMLYRWSDSRHAISLPESQEVRLELGLPISGVVQDEAGMPIAGASVTARSTAAVMEEPHYSFALGTTKTDEQGRWRIDDAPANLSPVSLHVSHPDYLSQPGSSSIAREQITVLTQGATVKGRVVDGSGKPVKGAQVDVGPTWGESRPVATDELGEYTLRNRAAGSQIVTAQAEGFAPEFREVNVPNRGEVEAPVIRLGTASTLRARVVDRAGTPVAGAYFGADTWRGHRWSLRVRIQTDAAGRITWTSAPSDAVLFDIFKDGYMRKRLLPLIASDREHVVTLDPELVISGTVTDATTGQPVPRFRVIQGREQVEGRQGLWWSHNDELECTGGRYSIRFDFPMKAQYVRIEASGFEPADSRAFRPDEGAQVQDFALKPASGVSGVLQFPDGRPAAGVRVALGTQEEQIILEEGLLWPRANVQIAITGPDGRFTFPKRSGQFLLVAADKAGFADASREDFEKTGKLVLQPWGRIEGEVWVGRKPAAHQQVSFTTRIPMGGTGIFAFGSGGHTASDEQGRFVFERVIAGPVAVSRDVMTMLPSGANNRTWCWQDAGEVQPGGTVKVIVGAKGRTVVGRVVLEGTPDDPVDWRRNQPVELQPTRAARMEATRQWNTFAANLDETGRFRIEDVVPGTYELNVPVDWPLESTPNGLPTTIGDGTATVTIPDGAENSPVDIGDVKARLYLKVGRLAPDFNAPRLDGGQFRLSDTRGKLVLLDFWATWCQPCLAEMPAMKDIQQTFGGDLRFLLVGVSCDEAAQAPATYTKANALSWTHVFGGPVPWSARAAPAKDFENVGETYSIRGIPATFLIGPNGRILARDLRGPALKEAVGKALSDEKLFSAAK